ncbi:hypothetical protein [uncultured Chryseobacterium sp.]|nr:hypothetical protein [uncultured Chryseobacterium sp.]
MKKAFRQVQAPSLFRFSDQLIPVATNPSTQSFFSRLGDFIK